MTLMAMSFGDQVLRLIGSVIGENVRQSDLVARIGGEEFALVMGGGDARVRPPPDHRGKDSQGDRCTQDRQARLGAPLWPRSSVSVGIATRRPDDDPRSLLDRADAGLYRAKERGSAIVP